MNVRIISFRTTSSGIQLNVTFSRSFTEIFFKLASFAFIFFGICGGVVPNQNILIGKVAARTGVAVSAVRFYEEAGLIRLREKLTSCIGCGCLSLQKCGLYNQNDLAAKTGTGPRYLIEA